MLGTGRTRHTRLAERRGAGSIVNGVRGRRAGGAGRTVHAVRGIRAGGANVLPESVTARLLRLRRCDLYRVTHMITSGSPRNVVTESGISHLSLGGLDAQIMKYPVCVRMRPRVGPGYLRSAPADAGTGRGGTGRGRRRDGHGGGTGTGAGRARERDGHGSGTGTGRKRRCRCRTRSRPLSRQFRLPGLFLRFILLFQAFRTP